MPSEDIAISVKNLTKKYRIFGHPGDRIKQALTLGRVRFHREFTALEDVSFEIKKGETVGIIGRNGSGKSTLLQLICGILTPTSGTVQVNGRISALLELGAGFNPEFTGRENVYFQGTILGLSKDEMDFRFDDIAAFADIGEFIDQPVRTYSSGMYVRLAFSVAISVDPDILVVDEALAVGDIGFQNKCLERIRELRDSGVTIFLVSHDIMLMRTFGDRLIYLEKGHIKQAGDPEAVGEAYIRDTARFVTSDLSCLAIGDESRKINRIHSVRAEYAGSTAHVFVDTRLSPEISLPEIVVQFRDPRGYVLYGVHARNGDLILSRTGDSVSARAILQIDTSKLAGDYGISISLNKLDAYGMETILDKRVGVATLHLPPPPGVRFHGFVNLGGRWLNEWKETSSP